MNCLKIALGIVLLSGKSESFFDHEDFERIGKDGIYGAKSPTIDSAQTQIDLHNELFKFNKWTAYGPPDSPTYVQAEPYADQEVLNILSGKYSDPEPVYSRIKGYPYSDKRPEFEIPLLSQDAGFSGYPTQNKRNRRSSETRGTLNDNPESVLIRRLKKREASEEEESKKDNGQHNKKGVAQDYYGAIRNTKEQIFGRANAQEVEKLSKLVKTPLFQDLMVSVLESLAMKKNFRRAIIDTFEGIVRDVSLTKRSKTKLVKEFKESEERDRTTEEQDEGTNKSLKKRKKKKGKKKENNDVEKKVEVKKEEKVDEKKEEKGGQKEEKKEQKEEKKEQREEKKEQREEKKEEKRVETMEAKREDKTESKNPEKKSGRSADVQEEAVNEGPEYKSDKTKKHHTTKNRTILDPKIDGNISPTELASAPTES